MDVPMLHCRYARLDQCAAAHRAPRGWLSQAECLQLERWREPRARAAWLSARWVAKQLVIRQSGSVIPAASIEICSRNRWGAGIRPAVWIQGRQRPWSLSISHTQQAVLVALYASGDGQVGVDLAPLDGWDRPGEPWWCTAAERAWASRDAGFVPRAWAVKEAVYKACHCGEGFTPARIEVLPVSGGTYACSYRGSDLSARMVLRLWQIDRHVAAVVHIAAPGSEPATGPSIPGQQLSNFKGAGR